MINKVFNLLIERGHWRTKVSILYNQISEFCNDDDDDIIFIKKSSN